MENRVKQVFVFFIRIVFVVGGSGGRIRRE